MGEKNVREKVPEYTFEILLSSQNLRASGILINCSRKAYWDVPPGQYVP